MERSVDYIHDMSELAEMISKPYERKFVYPPNSHHLGLLTISVLSSFEWGHMDIDSKNGYPLAKEDIRDLIRWFMDLEKNAYTGEEIKAIEVERRKKRIEELEPQRLQRLYDGRKKRAEIKARKLARKEGQK